MLRFAALTGLVLLVLPGVAAAPVVDITLSWTGGGNPFSTWRLDNNATIEGTTATNMRKAMDTDGNGDVSPAEVEAFKAQLMTDIPGSNVTLDGHALGVFSQGTMTLTGATGLVSSGGAIHWDDSWTGHFDASTASTHTLTMPSLPAGPASGEGFLGTLVYRAPSGYVIASTTGLPASAVLSPDKTSLTVQHGPSGPVVLVFEGASRGAPSVGLFPLVLMVGLAVWLRRR